MLSVRDISYSVGGRVILGGLSLELSAGSSAVVQGRSGSGKTTLLMCAMGLVKPDEGEILLGGRAITGMSRRRLAEIRRSRIGIVFQDGELLPELTPAENVALAALLSGTKGEPAFRRAHQLLDEFGVPTKTPTGSLSGGERQRTAVARALINEPELVLADEPTGALDEANRDAVADLLFSLPAPHKCAVLVATHDDAVAERADARFRLSAGALEEFGG